MLIYIAEMKLIVKFISSFLLTLLFASNNIWAAASAIDKLLLLSDSTKCIQCHEDISPDWETSHHSHSLIDIDVLTSIKKELNTPGVVKLEVLKSCASCHAPQINFASEEAGEMIIALIENTNAKKGDSTFQKAKKMLGSLNINCRVCHMSKGMAEGEISPNIIYGPGWDEHEHSHMENYGFDTIKSDYLGSIEFCTNCHRDIASESLSQVHSLTHKKETMERSKATNSTCKDCHMSSGHSFKHEGQ